MAERVAGPCGGGKLLSLVGLGFWQAWWMVAMCTDVLLPDPAESPFSISLSVLLLLLSCLGYLFVVLAYRLHFDRHLGRRGTLTITGILCVAGALAMGVVAHSDALFVAGGTLFIAAALAFSLGNALLLITWGRLWSTLAVGFVGRLLCASYTAAFVLFFLVRALPLGFAIAAMALLPIASLTGLLLAHDAPRRTSVRHLEVRWDALPVRKAIAALFVANVVWGISQRYLYIGGEGMMEPSFVFGAVCLFAFTLFMFVSPPTDDAAALYRPIAPAIVCGIALMQMLPVEDIFLGEGIMIFGGYCLDMLVMLVASDVAFRTQRSVVWVFGLALFFSRAGSLLGTIIGEVSPMRDQDIIVVALFCIIVFTLVGSLLFPRTELDRFYRIQVGTVSGSRLEKQCDAIAEACGLTAREREVLGLLAKGRSAPFISQELCIALGTVKNHISSIYRKVGICDRQSLHNVIERSDSA